MVIKTILLDIKRQAGCSLYLVYLILTKILLSVSDVLSRLTDADILIFPCSLSLPVCQAPDCDVLLGGERGESLTINENKQGQLMAQQ